jgi:diadenylate cyclase
VNRFLAFFDRPQMTWWDVVDILIVSLLIYEGLKLIRGTRAVQMAAGSLLILLLFYVSQLFPLQTVSWLIRSVLVYVVFAVIVLFQTDIRRGLSQLGSAPLFRYFGRAERAAETVEEVSAAAGMLSKRSIGALIVIEREIGLRNYVESGIPLDAEVSYDLLTTIFQPSGPMHDGAVILQEDRIAAAACFLPLTVNPGLDRDLGTRHRAAIGLTEECDAVAVVVSEERGEISMAIRGRLHRRLSVDDLHERLKAVMVHKRWPMGDATPAEAAR